MSTAGTKIPFRRRHAIYVKKLRRNPTAAESRFCCYLTALGLDYRFQQGFYHPFCRIADFYLPELNLIIEIDGPYHGAEEDRRKDDWFTRTRGIRIMRFTNDDVLSGEAESFLEGFCTNFVPMNRASCGLGESSDQRNQ
jgi:very-short-patch-repair endonuclease